MNQQIKKYTRFKKKKNRKDEKRKISLSFLCTRVHEKFINKKNLFTPF